MAAAMHARGRPLLADDIAAIYVDTSCSMVVPGFPPLKLWPKAARFMGDNPEVLSRLEPFSEKRGRCVTQGVLPAPLPLQRIYVLNNADAPKAEPLKPQEALVELVRHTYGRNLFQAVGTSLHFLRCSNVVKHVSVCSLGRPRSLPALSDAVRLVEEDLARNEKQSSNDHRSS